MGPSLYEMLTGGFSDELGLDQVSEHEQVVVSVLDNMQRILNSRAGARAHLPDYGLPDMSMILQGLPASSHRLIGALRRTLLRYEPRLSHVDVVLLPETTTARLRYAINAELKCIGPVRFCTEFALEGRVVVRHLKQQGRVE